MFGTWMCGQTLLFIVIANCAIHLHLCKLHPQESPAMAIFIRMGLLQHLFPSHEITMEYPSIPFAFSSLHCIRISGTEQSKTPNLSWFARNTEVSITHMILEMCIRETWTLSQQWTAYAGELKVRWLSHECFNQNYWTCLSADIAWLLIHASTVVNAMCYVGYGSGSRRHNRWQGCHCHISCDWRWWVLYGSQRQRHGKRNGLRSCRPAAAFRHQRLQPKHRQLLVLVVTHCDDNWHTASNPAHCFIMYSNGGIWVTLASDIWREARQPFPQGNHETLVVKDKIRRHPAELGVSKSVECDTSSFQCFDMVGWQKWHPAYKKLGVGLWRWSDCSFAFRTAPVVTTTSIILSCNKIKNRHSGTSLPGLSWKTGIKQVVYYHSSEGITV